MIEKIEEKETTYKALYPYNNVTMTSNGLTVEMDDTLGNVRYHIYHPIGSYFEFQQDGDSILRSAKDFDFIIGAGYKGADKEEIKSGNLRMQVFGDVDTSVSKNFNEKISGTSLKVVYKNDDEISLKDRIIKVGKNLKVVVGENLRLITAKLFSINANRIEIKAGKDSNTSEVAKGDINLFSSNKFNSESNSDTKLKSNSSFYIESKEMNITVDTSNIKIVPSLITMTGNVIITETLSVG